MRTVDLRAHDGRGTTWMQLEGYGLDWQDRRYPIYVALWHEDPSFFYQATNEAEQALLEAGARWPVRDYDPGSVWQALGEFISSRGWGQTASKLPLPRCGVKATYPKMDSLFFTSHGLNGIRPLNGVAVKRFSR
jgi:hypothetical protein